MASRKKTKKGNRKTVRRHRYSRSGKIQLPLDVRSDKDLPKFHKLLKNKDLTVILVYATWCPHCHTIMPHFDAAAKNPTNTVSAVKINETMLNSVNNYIKTNVNKSVSPINVEGYPSIILVNKNAEKVTDIEPVRNTESLKKLMENAGPLAESAKLSNKGIIKNNMLANIGLSGEQEGLAVNSSAEPVESIINNKNMNKNVNKNMNKNMNSGKAPSPINSFPTLNKNNNTNNNKNTAANKPVSPLKMPAGLKEQNEEAKEIVSLSAPISLDTNVDTIDIEPIEPPAPNTITNLEPAEKLSGGGGINRGEYASYKKQGGNLMSAITRTTYALAPAAILLATASMVMNGKKPHTRHTRRHLKGLKARRKNTRRKLRRS
jgi:thiol-disulfide isomerase/thioredoxin